MKISVLVTNYNYAGYVVEAIHSALTQTVAPHEIIVVDDSSTDNSREVLQSHFGSHSKVKLIYQANAGQMAALNAAYAASEGDVLAILDADDIYTTDYLKSINEIYTNQPHVDSILANVEYFGEKTGLMNYFPATGAIGHSPIRATFDKEWPGGPPSAWSCRRKIIERIMPFPEALTQLSRTYSDVCLMYGSCIMGAFRYYLSTALVKYRVHTSSSTAVKDQSINRGADRYEQHVVARVQGYYSSIAPLPPHYACQAVREFCFMQIPNKRELKAYARIIWAAPMPWWKRLSHIIQLHTHYRRPRVRKTSL